MAEYNTPEPDLRGSLASILSQTFEDFELILVDDGGNNDVEAILADFDDTRTVLLRNRENLGLVESLRRGVQAARSDWIARTDTDDLYDPRHLQKLVEARDTFPGYAVYSAMTVEFSDDGVAYVQGNPGPFGAEGLVAGRQPNHPATLISKTVIEEVGSYPDFVRAEDFALWSEMALKGHKFLMTRQATHFQRVELGDYRKRDIRGRVGPMRAQAHYYPLLGAPLRSYWRIPRSALLGAVPHRIVRKLRQTRSAARRVPLDLQTA